MKTKIIQWGNNLIIRIPKSIAVESQLKPNTEVDISLANGTLIITSMVDKNYNLEQLLSSITEKNIHSEQDTGISVGIETW